MNYNKKARHTIPVTDPAEWCDSVTQKPRKLRSWPHALVEPPFTVDSGVVLPGRRPGKDRAKAAVRVRLCRDGVTQEGGSVTPAEHIKRAMFPWVDAALTALEWVQMDLPDTDILLLVDNASTAFRPEDRPVSLASWRVLAAGQRWSVTPFETAEGGLFVGVFASRAARDSAEIWLWHYLAGSLLTDPSVEIRA
jgi:hypothetical protein